MMRAPDWQPRLDAVLRAAETRPFAWGRHDCALFVCDCLAAMTGEDPAARFRGRYATARGARGAIRRQGRARDLAGLATKVLGAPIAPAFARRGDVAEVETDDGFALGIVLGVVVALVAPEGLVRVATGRARNAWRVG